MKLCFNRLWDEFSLSKNVVELIPVEEDGAQGGILCFLDSGTFFMESNQETLRCSSVFDFKKPPQSGWEIFCLCWIENSSCCRQIAAHSREIQIFNLQPSHVHSPFFYSFCRGAEQGREMTKSFLNLISIGYGGKCFYYRFFQGKKKKKTKKTTKQTNYQIM